MTKTRHTPREVAAKLQEADTMHSEGKLHSEIARSLGISVMTYHRWRKARLNQTVRPPVTPHEPPPSAEPNGAPQEIDIQLERARELQLENARLRHLVTDLLLEKLKLEEALEDRGRSSRRAIQGS